VTKKETFEALPKWLVDTLSSSKSNIVLLMIGNKTDLEDKRQVTTKEAQEFAKANKILFMESSAKNGYNIEKAFECVTNIILDRIKKGEINPKEELGIKEGSLMAQKHIEESKAKKTTCC
jgi:GTPase SAR1 family protein